MIVSSKELTMRIKRILAALTVGLALSAASAVVGLAAHRAVRAQAVADADAAPNQVSNIKWGS